jgi:acid phosphatase
MAAYMNDISLRLRIRTKKLLRGVLLAVILFSPATAWTQSDQNNSARFLIISDWGGSASNEQKAVASAMSKEAERNKAQFVVTAGDNFHKDGIDSSTDPRWKTEFEDVYNFSSLQIPWYPSLGNHEYRGNVACEIEYSKLSARWKLPSRYYAQKERIDDSSFVLIVHLDTSPFLEKYNAESSVYHVDGQNTNQQIVWLDSVLTVSDARWTIVVGHHPVYAAASKHGDTRELIDRVLPVLTKHNVALYVSGHDHILQHLKHDQINFIICGGGSNSRPPDQREDIQFGAESLGFLSVTVSNQNIGVKIINEKSEILNTVKLEQK